MLTFQSMLQLHGFDQTEVLLVRHADNRSRPDGAKLQNLVISSWRARAPEFEVLRWPPSAGQFGGGVKVDQGFDYAASFLIEPSTFCSCRTCGTVGKAFALSIISTGLPAR